MNRRNFIVSSATALVASGLKANPLSSYNEDTEKGLRLRFLGTGAADWNGKDERGELRRLSSVLLDNRILIDAFRRLTVCPADIHNSFHNILASDKTGIPVINHPGGFIFAEVRVPAEIITGVSEGHFTNPDCPCNDIQDCGFP